MVAGEGRGGVGGLGQLSLCPSHGADLELMHDQAFVYIFPLDFNHVCTPNVSGCTEAHLARQMYAAHEQQRARAEMP